MNSDLHLKNEADPDGLFQCSMVVHESNCVKNPILMLPSFVTVNISIIKLRFQYFHLTNSKGEKPTDVTG